MNFCSDNVTGVCPQIAAAVFLLPTGTSANALASPGPSVRNPVSITRYLFRFSNPKILQKNHCPCRRR